MVEHARVLGRVDRVRSGGVLSVGVGALHVDTVELVKQGPQLLVSKLELIKPALDHLILLQGELSVQHVGNVQGIAWFQDVRAHKLLECRRAWVTLQVASHDERDLLPAQFGLLFLGQALLFVLEILGCFCDVMSTNESARLLHDVQGLSLADEVQLVPIVELRVAKDNFLRLIVL